MKEPKIRFKGFQGEWENPTIANTFAIRNGYTPSKAIKAFWDGGTIPWFRMEDIRENGGILKDAIQHITPLGVKGDGLFETNSIILATTATIGVHAMLISDSLANQQFTNFSIRKSLKDNYYPMFVYYSFFGIDEWCKKNTNSGGLLAVNIPYLLKQSFHTPILPEQQSIASYFQHLDNLIQSITKKIESLKQVKAASLQSMFPQEGETTPRVRFKGFEGEWSICPLKYFAKKSTEKNISMDYTITLTNSAEYGVINQRDFFDHDISNDDHINGYYVIHHDDFVYNPRVSTAAPVGPISRNLLGYSGVMSPLYLIFKVNGINKDFLSYYFKTMLWHNYMKLEGNTGARFDRLAISDEQFFNMPICVPRDEKEQRAIASYFTNLDRQITLHTQRLEKLKQIKAACLDKMFV